MSKVLTLLAAIGFAVANQAHAELYCVSTSTQLLNAIASANGGGASEIRVRSGVYSFTPSGSAAAINITDASDLEISGGWNTGCTQVTATSPDATVLSAQGLGRLLDIRMSGQHTNEIGLTYLSFRQAVSGPVDGGCVNIVSLFGASGAVRLDLNSFRLCTGSTAGTALRAQVDSIQMRLRGNLFVDNASTGAGVAFTFAGPGSTVYISNNTLSRNVSGQASGVGGLRVDGSSSGFVWMTNNVLWGNQGGAGVNATDLSILNATGVATTNLVGSQLNASMSFSSINRIQADPLFTSNDFRPQERSPLRNAGLNSVNGGILGVDLARDIRVQGGRIDIGAYEFGEVFANGFE